MLYYLYAFPTLVIVFTLLIYTFSRRGFRDYTARLENKVKTIERLSNIVFTKDMLSMFLKNSSMNTRLFFTQREIAEETGEAGGSSADDMPLMSMKDMAKLEGSLKNALQPSRDLERMNHDSSLIRKLMLIYGSLIALTEYFVVSARLFLLGQNLVFQLDGIVFGITIIFSVIMLLILMDLFNMSRRIHTAYDNVELNYTHKAAATATQEEGI